jgi:tRNA1(Val) A37 N6-methylase TrmN6
MPLQKYESNREQVRIYILNKLLSGCNLYAGKMTEKEIIDGLKKMIYNDETELFTPRLIKFILNKDTNFGSGIIKYNRHLTIPVNHFFPEMVFSKNTKGVSIATQFLNEEIFKTNFDAILLKNRFKFNEDGSNPKLSNFIIEGTRLVNGNQPVQNFPVGVAKWLINNFYSRKGRNKNLTILDPCLGWGGRLTAAMAFSSMKRLDKLTFLGTDVNSSIYNRYEELVYYWNKNISNSNIELIKAEHPTPFEEILENWKFQEYLGKVDMAITSPPYFSCEKYSDDPNQSYIKYPEYDVWKNEFLYKLLKNTYELLRNNGEFFLNIQDIRSKKSTKINLVNDSIELAESIGFKRIKTYYMKQPTHGNFQKNPSTNKYVQKLDGKLHKIEPILVFVK